MNFGAAIAQMREGSQLKRKGWNGAGMFIYLVPENRYAPTTLAGKLIAEQQADGLVPYGAYIAMQTAGGYVIPWVASQADVLADDWEFSRD